MAIRERETETPRERELVLVSSCKVSCSAQLSVWLRQQNCLTADEILKPQFNLPNNGSIGTAVEFESAGAVGLDELVIFEDFIVVHRFQDGILHEAAHHIFPRLVFERGDLPRSARDDDLEVLVDALDTLSSECSERRSKVTLEVLFLCRLGEIIVFDEVGRILSIRGELESFSDGRSLTHVDGGGRWRITSKYERK
jgi:hypothetical protein